jgi:hypothetical protein
MAWFVNIFVILNVYHLHKRIMNLMVSGNGNARDELIPSITRGYEPKRYLIVVGALI